MTIDEALKVYFFVTSPLTAFAMICFYRAARLRLSSKGSA